MKTNFHHVGCSWSLSTNTLGPRDRFGNRGATNYTLNVFIKVIAGVDLNASYIFIRILIVFDVDHDRLRQAVHHTASELNGWDIDPFLPVHSEVTSQIPNKGVTGVSIDVSNPYQKPPVTAPTFSQRPRPAQRFAPSRHRECYQLGHTQGKSTCLPLCSPRLHWSSSTAESVQMRFRACPSKSRVHLATYILPFKSSPFDVTQSGFDQPTPYSLSQTIDDALQTIIVHPMITWAASQVPSTVQGWVVFFDAIQSGCEQ